VYDTQITSKKYLAGVVKQLIKQLKTRGGHPVDIIFLIGNWKGSWRIKVS
jgi:hypothetical protein